jgi:hypothetical protein
MVGWNTQDGKEMRRMMQILRTRSKLKNRRSMWKTWWVGWELMDGNHLEMGTEFWVVY